jgi:hypothetical protein
MAAGSATSFVLDNFGVDSAELTAEHKKRLEALAFDILHTIFMSKREIWLFHLVGSASQTGTDAYNEILSKRRAESVRTFLEARLWGIPKHFKIIALGETSPQDRKIFENARDRYVGVTATLSGRIPPKIEPIVIDITPKAPALKDFTLQVIGFVMQTFGTPISIARIAMNFTIDDGVMKKDYTFKGEGVGAFVSGMTLFGTVGGGRSAARGLRQKFRAYARLSADDFAGKGAYLGILGVFQAGGEPRGASSRWRDFPICSIRDFQFPASIGGSPRLGEFRGRVTKGFNPPLPPFPAALPPGGIF